MKLRLLTVGKGAPGWAEEACGDFAKRLRRYGGVEELCLKPEVFRGDEQAVRRAEGQRILAMVSERDRLVALDERGSAPDSHEFARLIEEGLLAEGRLIFAIGGPYGHDPAVRSAAWRTVRLSALVLNHQVARLVWYEQVYRAMTLLHGAPYHH